VKDNKKAIHNNDIPAKQMSNILRKKIQVSTKFFFDLSL
jgi:hypothetical protein